MVQELTPLHHHLAQVRVRGESTSRGYKSPRHKPGIGLLEASIESVSICTDRSVKPILVNRRQNPSERGQRCAPEAVNVIVAAAIHGPEHEHGIDDSGNADVGDGDLYLAW